MLAIKSHIRLTKMCGIKPYLKALCLHLNHTTPVTLIVLCFNTSYETFQWNFRSSNVFVFTFFFLIWPMLTLNSLYSFNSNECLVLNALAYQIWVQSNFPRYPICLQGFVFWACSTQMTFDHHYHQQQTRSLHVFLLKGSCIQCLSPTYQPSPLI